MPWRRLAVLAERLAVVRGHHHERVGLPPGCEDRLEQRRERRIGRRHLAEVRIARPSRRERLAGGS